MVVVAAVEAINALVLPRRSPARALPEELHRHIAGFAGTLPTIDEAVNMCRPDLRGILGRRLRRHLPAKLSLSALCRMLLEVSNPREDDARRRQLYCAALTRRDDARSDEVALQRSLAALRYKLAQTDADDVPRAAMLQHEMRQLQRGAA